MIFNKHEKYADHAFLSPSNYSWVNYDDEKLEEVYLNHKQKMKGTELHDLASRLIDNRINVKKSNLTFNMYVNDAIGYRMDTEVLLLYSENVFGTADSISFNKNLLRIHDLKTGKTPASMQQLRIYSALFCLEYNHDPRNIDVELRIYQNNEILIENPDPEDIQFIMDKIIRFDKIIQELKDI